MGTPKNPEEYNNHILNDIIIDFKPKPKYDKYLNKQYGELIVKKYVGKDKYNFPYFWCECSCGAKKICGLYPLKRGVVTSCGHIQRKNTSDASKSHGLSRSRIYKIYHNMISRCYSETDHQYYCYGGRGITVCNEWLNKENGFMNFYTWAMDNGYKEGLSIDRKDVNKEYSPDNCRWSTDLEQARNKTVTVWLTYAGYTFPIVVWAEIIKIAAGTLKYRLNHGWTTEEILRTPLNQRRGNGYLCWNVTPEYLKYNKANLIKPN